MSQLSVPVSERDHCIGVEDAPVTLVEYGDFQCPSCGRAYGQVKAAVQALGDDLRFVYRNFPLSTLHENAENAAEAVEIADKYGKFWELHDLLFENQSRLGPNDLLDFAEGLGIERSEFLQSLEEHTELDRVREDFLGGVKSGVNGTPTFFINGERYDGSWEHGGLTRALRAAAGR